MKLYVMLPFVLFASACVATTENSSPPAHDVFSPGDGKVFAEMSKKVPGLEQVLNQLVLGRVESDMIQVTRPPLIRIKSDEERIADIARKAIKERPDLEPEILKLKTDITKWVASDETYYTRVHIPEAAKDYRLYERGTEDEYRKPIKR